MLEHPEEFDGWRKTCHQRFAQRLAEGIKNNSKNLLKPGGNVTLATVNYDFAYEVTDIFCETIAQMLIEGNIVNFDQFGKFEILIQRGKRINNPLTGFKDYIMPELKIIRFYPCKKLKARLRGDAFGRVEKPFGKRANDKTNEEIEFIEGNDVDAD